MICDFDTGTLIRLNYSFPVNNLVEPCRSRRGLILYPGTAAFPQVQVHQPLIGIELCSVDVV